jgi:hypothetical protein
MMQIQDISQRIAMPKAARTGDAILAKERSNMEFATINLSAQ